MTDTLIGQTIGGCRVIRLLGRGGMSQIYLAHQESIGRNVVLKVLSPGLLGDPTFMARFTREVETTARLQHPHIVPIYDYGQEGDLPYIVMAYEPGGSLEDLIAGGPVPLDLAVRIMEQVAEALDYAHEMGVIHRDIKPANVLLDSKQNAILTDFGIAKVIADTQELTAEDKIVGTIHYLAPELITPHNFISPAVDIYALGVTLYRMLSGRLPFDSESISQVMWAHVNEPAPLLVRARPDLPEAIDAVIQKALAKAPAARYPSAGEMAKDLAQVAAEESLPPVAEALSSKETLPVDATPPPASLQEAIQRVIRQVVKLYRPDGGTGSGIYLPDDRVITALHVVQGAAGVYAAFQTGERIEADVVAVDPARDLALLKLRRSPRSLSAGQLSGLSMDFEPLSPGEPLAAIGHPLGLDWAVTGGHYNGLHQPGEEPLERFGITLDVPLVHVDVVINAGNSGGPIIDAQGRLIGLADSIINPAIANNVGFAIYAPAVWEFWEEHRDDTEPLVAYTCNHHHPPDLTYCPLTGKPVRPKEAVPMPSPDSTRYSCGHLHARGLRYCPQTGKPITAAEDATQAGQATLQEGASESDRQVTCTNCGETYPARLGYCPACGKPAR